MLLIEELQHCQVIGISETNTTQKEGNHLSSMIQQYGFKAYWSEKTTDKRKGSGVGYAYQQCLGKTHCPCYLSHRKYDTDTVEF